MTVASISPSKKKAKSDKKRPLSGEDGGQVKRTRTKSPVVRVISGRIYDPENGRTCHQCRQKTMDFSASCKNLKAKGNKPCTLNICHKCLLNRYGEIAEEVSQSGDWLCPRCRGICNCSFCMKKKGHKPTGMLVYAAKVTGLGSASNLIQVKGVENLDNFKRPVLLKKKFKVTSPSKIGVYKYSDTSRDETWSSTDSTPESHHKKSGQATNRKGKKGSIKMSNNDCCGDSVEIEESFDSDIDRADAYVAPQGFTKRSTDREQAQIGVNLPLRKIDILRTALGIDLSPEDVDMALQFLEFCASFGKAYKVSKDLTRSGQKMDTAATSLAKVDSVPFAENQTQVPTPTS